MAGVQYALDRGDRQDWFAGVDIRIAAALGALGIAGFAFYSLRAKNALFDVRIFKDRNFAMACLVMALLGLGMFGTIVIQPVLLEQLLDYPILTTGIVMAPRGIATAISMMVVGRLVSKLDARLLVGVGMVLSALGSHAMTHYSLDIDIFWVIWPAMLDVFQVITWSFVAMLPLVFLLRKKKPGDDAPIPVAAE